MTSGVADLLAANQAFYDAHEERDAKAMSDLWAHTNDVWCVHPGWPILRGWSAVGDSWDAIIGGPGRLQFILTDVVAHADGATGWVSLNENLVGPGETSTVATVNLFRLTDNGWRLFAHHGSPVMASL